MARDRMKERERGAFIDRQRERERGKKKKKMGGDVRGDSETDG
jgi:hypothetical protein